MILLLLSLVKFLEKSKMTDISIFYFIKLHGLNVQLAEELNDQY